MTRVINIHHKKPYDVYCGREGQGMDGYFGNPTYQFETFRPYFYNRISSDPEYKQRVESLRGKTLACFCAPSPCHAMIYVEYLDGKTVQEQMKEYAESIGRHVQSNIFDEF